MRKALQISGMHCDACIRRVTQGLGKLPSAQVDEVRVGSAIVDTTASDADILAAVAKSGFQATIVETPGA